MASLLDIRRRLRSVKNTQQITRAMKMVSAAKLRRAQDRVIAARPYARVLADVLANLSGSLGESAPPLLAERPESRVLFIVVAGDKGLAGAFNANVNRALGAKLRDRRGTEISLLTVGKKAGDFWRRRSFPIVGSYPGIFGRLEYAHAREIAGIVSEKFLSGEIDAAYIVYNEFKSIIQQVVRVDRVLPVTRATPESTESGGVDYLYEPGPEAILQRLLPRFVEFSLFKVLLESAAAEHGARMTAMDAATKNAGELIDGLTLTYNRARQARITRELIEIVSGAAALD